MSQWQPESTRDLCSSPNMAAGRGACLGGRAGEAQAKGPTKRRDGPTRMRPCQPSFSCRCVEWSQKASRKDSERSAQVPLAGTSLAGAYRCLFAWATNSLDSAASRAAFQPHKDDEWPPWRNARRALEEAESAICPITVPLIAGPPARLALSIT
jgi:hypothetical protein